MAPEHRGRGGWGGGPSMSPASVSQPWVRPRHWAVRRGQARTRAHDGCPDGRASPVPSPAHARSAHLALRRCVGGRLSIGLGSESFLVGGGWSGGSRQPEQRWRHPRCPRGVRLAHVRPRCSSLENGPRSALLTASPTRLSVAGVRPGTRPRRAPRSPRLLPVPVACSGPIPGILVQLSCFGNQRRPRAVSSAALTKYLVSR